MIIENKKNDQEVENDSHIIGQEVFDTGGTKFKNFYGMSHREFGVREIESSPTLNYGERKNRVEVPRWGSTTQNIDSSKGIEPGFGQSEKEMAKTKNDKPARILKDKIFKKIKQNARVSGPNAGDSGMNKGKRQSSKNKLS